MVQGQGPRSGLPMTSQTDVEKGTQGDAEEPQILRAIEAKDVRELTYLIEGGADINCYSKDGFSTPLIKAIECEDYEIRRRMVKILIKWKVKVNQRLRKSGFTAMHKAIARRDREVIKMLINAGGDTTIRGFNGSPVLMWSVNDHTLLGWLLENNHCDADTRAEQMNGTVLFYYEEQGDDWADAIETALAHGAHLYHRDYLTNKTVYDLAEEHKRKDILIKLNKHIFKLVDRGDFDTIWMEIHRSFDRWNKLKNQDGKTPYELAMEKGNEELSQLLDSDNIKRFHETIEECVAKAGEGDIDAVRHCCEDDFIDPKCLSKSCQNPIHTAAENNHKNVVEYLLSTGVDVNMPDGKYCMTALHYAAGNGHLKTVEFLINRGADLNLTDTNGMTPLEYANYMVQYEGKEFDLLPLAELFFKHGYDPNRPTSTGLTFLHEVATYSQALVDLAVENGANMHLKSVAMGQTIEQMLENDIKECKDDDRKKILMYMSNYIQEKATQEAAVNSLSDSQSDRFSELDRLNDKTDQNVDAPLEKDQKKQSKSCTIM